MKIDEIYIDIVKRCLNGYQVTNQRRNITRHQIDAFSFEYDMDNGFPLLQVKRVPFKKMKQELFWFLEGNNDAKELYNRGCDYWVKDAMKYGGLTFEQFLDWECVHVGFNYSKTWRGVGLDSYSFGYLPDQITALIEGMKKDIYGSRLIVEAWNPSLINETALPPCHKGFQIVGKPCKKSKTGSSFALYFEMRSVDVYLGLPTNIASYALLGYILEIMTGHKFQTLGFNGKAVHVYDNAVEACNELLTRDISNLNKVELIVDKSNFDTSDIDSFLESNTVNFDVFKLDNYEPYDNIKVEMLA